jgi:hypothetical protein
MKLFASSHALEIGQLIGQTAHELAQRLLPASLQSISPGLSRQTLPAARGYVRAKIGGLLRAELAAIDPRGGAQTTTRRRTTTYGRLGRHRRLGFQPDMRTRGDPTT